MVKHSILAAVIALAIILPGLTVSSTPIASAAIDGCNVSASTPYRSTSPAKIIVVGSGWCSSYQSAYGPQLYVYLCNVDTGRCSLRKSTGDFWGSSGNQAGSCYIVYSGPYRYYTKTTVVNNNGQSESINSAVYISQGGCSEV
jgi:hypothetical protein